VRWSLAAGQVVRDAQGRRLRFAGVDLDITARKRAEESQLTLAREIDHRAKNLLAIVQSIVRLSRAETMPEFIVAVDGRIEALSRAHNLLSENYWQGVDLGRIVAVEIAPSPTPRSRRAVRRSRSIPRRRSLWRSRCTSSRPTRSRYGALSVPQGKRRGRVGDDARGPGAALDLRAGAGPPTRPRATASAPR
jgi:hypothetical protein